MRNVNVSLRPNRRLDILYFYPTFLLHFRFLSLSSVPVRPTRTNCIIRPINTVAHLNHAGMESAILRQRNDWTDRSSFGYHHDERTEENVD